MNLRSIVVLLTLFAPVACSEPLEFADWTIPVPEGTRIVEYAGVSIEERTGVIEMVGEFVIGEASGNVEATFYQPLGLVADDAGRVFVLDRGSRQVKLFGPDGTYMGSLGQEGQGPGEFQFPRSIALAGGQIVVSDNTRARLIRWAPSGEFIDESPVEFARGFSPLIGQEDGSLVVSFDVRNDDWPLTSGFGRVTSDGKLAAEYFELRAQLPLYRHDRGWQALRLPGTRPKIAATPTGSVYLTRGDEYQVLALTVQGNERWALRVASSREPYDEAAVNEAIDRYAEMLPDMHRGNIDLPHALPALGDIAVDGHGHLYVFPYADETALGDERAVDVYSSDGKRLFSGLIRQELSGFPDVAGGATWQAAIGDSVYALATSAGNDERIVVRYRLVEPFE